MADYRNCTCIACRNEFTPDDDIVVCPECGTPYHRDCWNEHGHCINTELHQNGTSWQNPNNNANNENDRERILCHKCGELSPKSSSFCIHCGQKVDRTDKDDWQTRSFIMPENSYNENSNDDMGGATVREISGFVGSNVPYFLMRFKFFFESKRKLAPNFICIIFPQFWFAYRKMWLGSLVIVLISFLLSIPSSLSTLAAQTDMMLAYIQPQLELLGEEAAEIIKNRIISFSQLMTENKSILSLTNTICSYASLAMRMVLFLFGNYIYYRHSIKKIKSIRESNKSLIDPQSRIRIAGGTSVGFIFIAVLAQFILTSVLTYIALMI